MDKIKDVLSFKGTINRQEWWVSIIVLFVVQALLDDIPFDIPLATSLVVFGLSMTSIWFMVAVNKARMNEAGWSAWWMLIPFLPLVIGGFFEPKQEDNKYA